MGLHREQYDDVRGSLEAQEMGWRELGAGYPVRWIAKDGKVFAPREAPGVHAALRAVFDVLAPYDVELRHRRPIYEHATGGATIDEIYGLAWRLTEAALGGLR